MLMLVESGQQDSLNLSKIEHSDSLKIQTVDKKVSNAICKARQQQSINQKDLAKVLSSLFSAENK